MRLSYKDWWCFLNFLHSSHSAMWKILITICLIQYWKTASSSFQSVAVIRNVSMMPFNITSTIINGTCNECLCAIRLNKTGSSSSSSFNCFSNNHTCQMFFQTLVMGSFVLINNTPSAFYFFSWPTIYTTLTTSEYLRTEYRSFLFHFSINLNANFCWKSELI